MIGCTNCKKGKCGCSKGISLLPPTSGIDGVSVTNVVLNENNTFTFFYSNGSSTTTDPFNITIEGNNGLGNGSYVLHYFVPETFQDDNYTFNLPEGVLEQEGDVLEIETIFTFKPSSIATARPQIKLNNTSDDNIVGSLGFGRFNLMLNSFGNPRVFITVKMIRLTNILVQASSYVRQPLSNEQTTSGYHYEREALFEPQACLNLDTLINSIYVTCPGRRVESVLATITKKL